MLESYKNERIKFSRKGIQKDFITEAKKLLGLTGFALAKKLEINQRTLTDWTREKFTMSYVSAKKLSILAKLSIPFPYRVITLEDHLRNIGRRGGKNKIILYGKVAPNEEYRKKKWRQWWEKTGQYKKVPKGFQSIIKIKVPKKNTLLAEFVGIMLGDGGLAPYHAHITLSDKETNYIIYVKNLITQLFGVIPKVHKFKNSNAVDIVVQRKQMVDFCQNIGLVLGNKVKQQVDIPLWVKEDRNFSRECVRGLIDTDGCFFTHSYRVGNKKYSYLKIAFTSASLPLVRAVAETLVNFGYKIRVSKNLKDVRIENTLEVARYISEIGSHNQKHLDKIRDWKIGSKMLK